MGMPLPLVRLSSLDLIRGFVAVGRRMSITLAAQDLCLTQSAVSRQVNALEEALGTRLFHRGYRSISFTPEGERLFRAADGALQQLQDVLGELCAAGELRPVTVSASIGVTGLWLLPRLSRFQQRHPGVDLRLSANNRVADLRNEGIDLAIRFGEPRASALVARKLLETRVLTVAAPAYLRRHGRPATPQALSADGHTCIDFRDPASGQPYAWEFHRGRKRLSVPTGGRLIVNDVGTMLHACLAGYGIAQMMSLGIGEFLAKGKLLELFPDWPDERFPLYVLYPSRKHLPAKTRAFVDFLVELCGAG